MKGSISLGFWSGPQQFTKWFSGSSPQAYFRNIFWTCMNSLLSSAISLTEKTATLDQRQSLQSKHRHFSSPVINNSSYKREPIKPSLRNEVQQLEKKHETNYHKVARSGSVYYSILVSLGQRSQFISIKFPLHKQSENPWVCY